MWFVGWVCLLTDDERCCCFLSKIEQKLREGSEMLVGRDRNRRGDGQTVSQVCSQCMCERGYLFAVTSSIGIDGCSKNEQRTTAIATTINISSCAAYSDGVITCRMISVR